MTMSITKEYTRFISCSLLSDCKNVQKSALKSVNVQRTEKSILQMFAFSFFEGSHNAADSHDGLSAANDVRNIYLMVIQTGSPLPLASTTISSSDSRSPMATSTLV